MHFSSKPQKTELWVVKGSKGLQLERRRPRTERVQYVDARSNNIKMIHEGDNIHLNNHYHLEERPRRQSYVKVRRESVRPMYYPAELLLRPERHEPRYPTRYYDEPSHCYYYDDDKDDEPHYPRERESYLPLQKVRKPSYDRGHHSHGPRNIVARSYHEHNHHDGHGSQKARRGSGYHRY